MRKGRRARLESAERGSVLPLVAVLTLAIGGLVVGVGAVGVEVVAASNGTTARMPVRQISSQGRDATGVLVMNLDEGATLATAAPIIQADEDDASPA